jgi:hypothetical protein
MRFDGGLGDIRLVEIEVSQWCLVEILETGRLDITVWESRDMGFDG